MKILQLMINPFFLLRPTTIRYPFLLPLPLLLRQFTLSPIKNPSHHSRRFTLVIRSPVKNQRDEMLGLSYGELFLLLGATAAVIGPKDLPMIARTLGRLAGRSIGYVQLARGQLDNIMQQSQARQVHKELQDTMAQLEAIRQEIRTISFVNPGPMTRRLVDNIEQISSASNDIKDELEGQAQGEESTDELQKPVMTESRVELQKPTQIESRLNTEIPQNFTSVPSGFSDMHSKATAYEKLAESGDLSSVPMTSSEMIKELTDESGLLVLPVSAESTGLLPKRKGDAAGSDVLLEAILEAEVARNAKDFFSQHQNQQVKLE